MKKLLAFLFALPLFLISCQDNGIDSLSEQETNASRSNGLELVKVDFDKNIMFKKGSNKNNDFASRVANLNESLIDHGIQLEKMEFFGAEGAGNTVYFKDVGNKQIGHENVPNDPRNWFNETNAPGWTEGTIPFWTDGSEQGTSMGAGMTSDQTLSAIYSAMNTWGSINCSDGLRVWNVYTTTPGLDDGVSTDGDAGFVQFLEGFGGFPGYAPGTILHGGNLPAAFFEQVTGSTNVLGITFTFTWIEDINQNGKPDVAIKEIYINDGFNWVDNPNAELFSGEYDYETVVLHEAGHGLNQAHFGKAFRNNGNGKLKFSPHALMNAGYTIGRRDISGTDNAGHCSMWGDWPNN